MRASFQATVKYCVRRIALNNTTKRHTMPSRRCFRAMLGIPSGSGALPTLRPRMTSWTSVGFVSLGSLAGARVCPHRPINQLNHCREGRIVHRLKLSLQDCRQGLRISRSPWELGPLVYQGRWSGDSHQPSSHLTQRLVFWIKAF